MDQIQVKDGIHALGLIAYLDARGLNIIQAKVNDLDFKTLFIQQKHGDKK
jgi:hypothetical protein